MFYQFEGPLLRLMIDEKYELLVQGDQQQYLRDAAPGHVPQASLWVYRFYDQAATTFTPPPHESLVERVLTKIHRRVTAEGFDIETAAAGLYDLIMLIRAKTGAEKVHLVAHSMGGLVARCMMQKICLLENERSQRRMSAKDIVAKLFTYGTPHGGILFQLHALDWAEQTFGPAGADIFAPEKMYGYLDKDARFGDVPKDSRSWDPQAIDPDIFDPDDIFCLVGTDPKDYGLPRIAVGPKSDGLVRIEHAYVRKANRAYVHKSHSGTYGEVNSEEGYQNLRRFLFGRWGVCVDFVDLPAYRKDDDWEVWQADMRLAIRGLPIVMSEQLAAHWCPIQLNDELKRLGDTPDHPVPLLKTFLLDPSRWPDVQNRHGGRARYILTLRVFKLDEQHGSFHFGEHLEQVPDWADSLIVDVGPRADGSGLQAWTAWNSRVVGTNDEFDPITEALSPEERRPSPFARDGDTFTFRIELPPGARALKVLGPTAALKISVSER